MKTVQRLVPADTVPRGFAVSDEENLRMVHVF